MSAEAGEESSRGWWLYWQSWMWEICIFYRKNKASVISENRYGKHYLVTTTNSTNLNPQDYIGSAPSNTHLPFEDSKKVKISKDDSKIYIKYLYLII